MTLDVRDYVNVNPPLARISDISKYVRPVTPKNAIDQYRTTIRETLDYGTAARLEENSFLGRLLFLRVVSATEAYFRKILSDTLRICPTARSLASDKQINLGGLLWHGTDRYSLSAFDNLSFASAKEVKSCSNGFVGFELKDPTFKDLLSEYEKVCQLRHSIVHAEGLIPGRNAVLLDIPKSADQVEVVVRFDELQEAASVTSTLVSTYNRELFYLLCKRWAINWRNLSEWSVSAEKSMFLHMWKAFHSKGENEIRPGRSAINKAKCTDAVRSEFSI